MKKPARVPARVLPGMSDRHLWAPPRGQGKSFEAFSRQRAPILTVNAKQPALALDSWHLHGPFTEGPVHRQLCGRSLG